MYLSPISGARGTMSSGWNRREVLTTLGSSAAAAVCAPPVSALAWWQPSPASALECLQPGPSGFPLKPAVTGFPLESAVTGFRAAAAGARGLVPTGIMRDAYLHLIDGIVRFFVSAQDARGAIIDPYEQKERQYSTPAFALAGATLCAAKPDPALLAAVVKAMQASCADLADGKAADGHADFFTVLLMHADRILAPLAGEAASAAWRRDLGRIVPEQIYRRQPTDKAINNWNLVAVAGEWMRTRAGLGVSESWIEASLERQMPLFTDCGMYRDPNDPMAYDHFARLWALDLMDEAYHGAQAAALETILERGAWASLLMQSPWGELPCGGRSAHHQWNEAEQAVTYESFARRFMARGDRLAARACKRAAHLATSSIRRWIRPSGELWVVKNRMDPRRRHGYESYSFHSQYNLLTAAMLAIAWARADDTIAEGPCPGDTGGFVVTLQPAFHKVVANAGGTYVEIDTGADAHYNPTGLLRVHHRDVPPETLSDGVSPAVSYTVPSKPERSLALGPAWRDRAGTWHALAEHAGADLDPAAVTPISVTAARVEFEIVYRGRLRGGATSVVERVTITPGRVDISHRVEGDVDAVRHYWPFLVTDGDTPSTVSTRGATASVTRGGGTIEFTALTPGAAVSRLGVSLPCRNGFMDGFVSETPERTTASQLTLRRS